MALTVKSLFAGTLPVSATTANFTPTTGKGAIVKSILFVNKTGSAVTVTATLNAINICPPAMSVPGQSSISLETELTLADSDILVFTAGAPSSIDCVVSGMIRDN